MAGLVGLAAGAAAMVAVGAAGGPGGIDRAAMEQVVREYILAHPEIIPEAMARLQRNEAGKVVAANRTALETPYRGAVAGPADADVTLVEFFDYACGYCRQSVADVDRLLAEDRKLRVVFRELPILGPGSEEAAKASLAAAGQDRFLPFHRAMYAAGRPAAATIASARKASGIAPGEVPAAVASAEIDKNIELARTLNLTGTPSFIIGDQVLNGAVGYDALKKAIAEARAARKG
ncbi:DsbA family protein [Sphingomonas solaris]|uniref:DsbA family protein n=1 Tax=Alterirhizorhabdus solaris TaxID=2529389 RepID=A0A558QVE9_9SPHN|nr:DsbA family protein [Sphingomonas solaris]TVV71123.1 DsbA family protein [Sphingomonas solaris]